jgi:DNA sulfur modification protein DndC
MDRIVEAIELTRRALTERVHTKWIIAFSGGKDSSALLKIFCAALRRTPEFRGQILVVYCDTGVESPVLDDYVRRFFAAAEQEFQSKGLSIQTAIVCAPVRKRFFVKIVGRGYPPPTNAFRWCTKDLRIAPVAELIATLGSDRDVVVAIGSRRDESEQRRRSIEAHGGGHWQVQTEANHKYELFLPLLNLNLETVWDAVFSLGAPESLDAHALERLYRGAAGECPVVKGPTATPCAKGRFGCWTCTVVRRDRSAEGLIQEGFAELKPYLELRNWLSVFRNQINKRWPVRRSGRIAPGPFSITARLEILTRLRALQVAAGRTILSDGELACIRELLLEDVAIERQIFGRATASSKRVMENCSIRLGT